GSSNNPWVHTQTQLVTTLLGTHSRQAFRACQSRGPQQADSWCQDGATGGTSSTDSPAQQPMGSFAGQTTGGATAAAARCSLRQHWVIRTGIFARLSNKWQCHKGR
ncbi:unnamed protein product, partial [Ectocarpus sp. 12 AP-2014]